MNTLKTLAKKSKRGDEKAQHQLYDLLKGKMMGICYRYSECKEDANDVFQEAMIKVFENIDQAMKARDMLAWAYRVTVNTAIDHFKKNKSKLYVNHEQLETVEFRDDDASVLEKMEAEDIVSLLQLLPANHRIVFNLYMIEGFDHREIAEKLAVAESTSRVILTRAKKKLIQLLQKKTCYEQSIG